MNTITVEKFRDAIAAGRAVPAGTVVRLLNDNNLPSVTGSRALSFIFSDETVDRYGDTIRAAGWKLDAFKANPIALFGHDASSVENVIGRAKNVRVKGTQLLGDIEFADASVNPTAEVVYQLFKAGFMKAVSVGFAPIKWKQSSDPARRGGVDFLEQDLLEISCCPVPANPSALIQARAAGIDIARLGLAQSDTVSRAQFDALKEVVAMLRADNARLRRGF